MTGRCCVKYAFLAFFVPVCYVNYIYFYHRNNTFLSKRKLQSAYINIDGNYSTTCSTINDLLYGQYNKPFETFNFLKIYVGTIGFLILIHT